MSFTLELFPEYIAHQVLAECRRLLQPAGRLGILALSQPVHPGPGVRLYTWFHRRFPTVIDCRPIRTAEILSVAGFQIIQRHARSLWSLPQEAIVAIK